MPVERYYPRRSCRSPQLRLCGPSWSPAEAASRTGCAKQYELVGSRRVIDHAADTARAVSDGVVLVVPAADVAAEGGVAGGATRSASVRAGLAAVPVEATIICVHDAARPFASAQLFRSVIEAIVDGADGAVPGLAVADTIKRIDADGRVVETPRPRRAGRRADPASVPRGRVASGSRPRQRRHRRRGTCGGHRWPSHGGRR